MKANKVNWISVEQTLTRHNLRLFTLLDLQRLLRVSPIAVRFLVHRYTKRGALLRLRNGLYALANRAPSEFVIANRLYEPSYVSFEFAMAYYHLIPEAVYEVTSATTRTSRRFEVLGKAFTYRRLKPSAFTGYRPEKVGGRVALIAEPEKAFVDSLYFASLGKLSLPERLDLSILQHDRLRAWADLYQRPELVERVASLQ